MGHRATDSMNKVGLITPPAWFDISPAEFSEVAGSSAIVMQTIMRPPDFDYAPDNVRAAVPELLECARSLAAAGADVIGQFGFPFSLVHGWQGAQAVQHRVKEETGVPLVMMGVEAVHALRAFGIESVAVASTYYSHRMEEVLASYLREAGIATTHMESWQAQGLVGPTDGGVFVGAGELDPMGWKTPEWAVTEAVRRVATKAPRDSCILVVGGGMRLLHIVDALERELDTTIVAGDLSLYWGILKRLGHMTAIEGYGRLIGAVSRSNAL